MPSPFPVLRAARLVALLATTSDHAFNLTGIARLPGRSVPALFLGRREETTYLLQVLRLARRLLFSPGQGIA